ncbi:MAG: histidine phosphatase family protein, partial [Dehalococcoidales bacterium]|nr:histidine phosphatase family protein [Dehalococcoidales bacterium]
MTEIILVRHGETEWNVGEIFRGRIDIDLNDTGRKQAELLGEYLSESKIEAVYSGPLKRALNTAQAIARYHHLEAQIAAGLNDLDFGQWQGLSLQEVREKYREAYAEWANHPERVKLPGGETLGEVRARAIKVVNEVIARHKGAVVLVSHRVVNKVLICALLGMDNSHFWNIRQDTCGITRFTYEKGQFILTK